MLESTFLHLPGVGVLTERRLWNKGIRTWGDFEVSFLREPDLFPELSYDRRMEALLASKKALSHGDAAFFAKRLPPREHYRIAATFPRDTVFLDIETTGLSTYYDYVTLVGLSRTNRYACHIRGTHNYAWRELLEGAKCLVTFNGTAFDLKFLAKEFPDLELPKAHVDLRFVGRRVALKGSQKAIEAELGVVRSNRIDDMRGLEAVLSWFEYKAGSINAGRRLARYNHADVEGMKTILDAVISRLSSREIAPPRTVNGVSFAAFQSTLKFTESAKQSGIGKVHVPAFRGRKGPKVNYSDLAKIRSVDGLRIVGIDLTGSAKRPTGWCLLEGRHVQTNLLKTDDELIAATTRAAPDIVSIDSPLSLPKGRRSVLDSDVGRKKYGITRECERVLKRRGVNVYPCLIQSMQALTARGIKLAGRLRSKGIPVIESYPGAAQDIMGIPRKRASMDQLKHGLRLFGISGNFLAESVSHDELDAVTSAIVGLYFWCGKFEALGNEDEEFLIIPDLCKDVFEWNSRRVVGISGSIAAGKTTAATRLTQTGFSYARYSLVLTDILKKRGMVPSRQSLQEVGKRIHRRPGQRWLNRKLLAHVGQGQDMVIDGLRWPVDHAYWVERFGPSFFHIHIETKRDLRQLRYVQNGGSKDEFEEASIHSVEQQTAELMQLSDVVIPNNRSMVEFAQSVGQSMDSRFSKKEVPCQPQL